MANPASPVAVAILDDYLDAALGLADWNALADVAPVVAFPDHLEDLDALVERLEPFNVIVAMRERTPFPRQLLARLPKLKLLVTTGMSNTSIDLAAASELGIVVEGTPLAHQQTAELTWALVMAVVRNVVIEDRALRDGRWQTELGIELEGSTLGLLGLGRLGRIVAGYGISFGMSVVAWSEHLDPVVARELGVEPVERDELFARSDVVSVHLRLSDRTRGLVGARELELLGPRGYIVNAARGPIIDEGALVAALHSGTIAGAALDVYDVEPLPADHPLRFTPRTTLTPHIGFVAERSYREAYGAAATGIRAWLDGSPPRQLNG